MKSAGDGTIVERGTPQLNVQELGREQQLTLHEHETQEAFSELEGKTQGAFSKLEEETQEALSELEDKYIYIYIYEQAALAHRRRQYPTHIVITHEESKISHRCGGSSVALFLAGGRSRGGKRREECVGVRRRGPDGYAGDAGYT